MCSVGRAALRVDDKGRVQALLAQNLPLLNLGQEVLFLILISSVHEQSTDCLCDHAYKGHIQDASLRDVARLTLSELVDNDVKESLVVADDDSRVFVVWFPVGPQIFSVICFNLKVFHGQMGAHDQDKSCE
jgi:hypothetical protein